MRHAGEKSTLVLNWKVRRFWSEYLWMLSKQGARLHNLKNLDVEIPREKLVVITSLSGSGKSSLAFDTLMAEGQRRYVESLSALCAAIS